MPLAPLAVAGITAGAQALGAGLTQLFTRGKRKRAEKENKKLIAKQQGELKKGVDAEVLAHKDLERELEGQAAISPEAAFARDENERATASTIASIERMGGSATERANLISGAVSKGQRRGSGLLAQQAERRMGLKAAARARGIAAAQAKLSGKREMIGLADKGRSQTLQEQSMINQAAAQNFGFFSKGLTDIASTYLKYGSGVKPVGEIPA